MIPTDKLLNPEQYIRKFIHEPVYIKWNSEDDDWPYYFILKIKANQVKLIGLPDHEFIWHGKPFWMDISEIEGLLDYTTAYRCRL